MKKVITIWKKELKDTIRDRRTLLAMVVMPMFLMPLMIIGIGKFTEYQIQKTEETVVKTAVENSEAAPVFVELLDNQEKIEVVDLPDDIYQSVRENEIDIGIILPADFEERMAAQESIQIKVVRNSINTDSSAALSRIAKAATAFNNQVMSLRFSEQEINAEVLNGLVIIPEDVATEKEVGGFGLGFLLPLFIIMWSIIGGQYTAIDISAGEKERKTLESLLLTPVRRVDVVFGKFLAVATAALFSVLIALSSLYAAIAVFGFGNFESIGTEGTAGTSALDFSIDLSAILVLFGISILLVLMFSAVQLSISIFAKSYKEAQSYIGPSYLVVILPTVIVNMLPNFQPAVWFFALPVVNAILLFKEVLIGVYDISHIITTVVSLVVYSIVSIWLAVKIYTKEGVLFRD